MSGPTHGGKGDNRRPPATPDAYAKGFDAIDWNRRDRVADKGVTRAEPKSPQKQRGYFMAGPSTGELIGCLGVVAAFFILVGVLLAWAVPWLWGLAKPWLHAVTA